MGWLGRMLLPLVLYDLAAAVWMRALPDGGSLMAQFLAAVSALAVLTPAWRRQPGGQKRAPFAAGKAAAFAAAGVCGSLCANSLVLLLDLRRYFGGYEAAVQQLFSPPLGLQVLAVGLVIPAAEEMIFRGYGYGSLRSRLGVWPAALVSALLFGLYHGNVLQGAYAFLLGLALAWSLEQEGRLAAPWLIHAAANLTSVAGEYLAPGEPVLGPVLLILAAAGGAGMYGALKMVKNRNQKEVFQ